MRPTPSMSPHRCGTRTKRSVNQNTLRMNRDASCFCFGCYGCCFVVGKVNCQIALQKEKCVSRNFVSLSVKMRWIDTRAYRQSAPDRASRRVRRATPTTNATATIRQHVIDRHRLVVKHRHEPDTQQTQTQPQNVRRRWRLARAARRRLVMPARDAPPPRRPVAMDPITDIRRQQPRERRIVMKATNDDDVQRSAHRRAATATRTLAPISQSSTTTT